MGVVRPGRYVWGGVAKLPKKENREDVKKVGKKFLGGERIFRWTKNF